MAVDASGNVFVADQGSNTVKEISAVGGYTTVTTLGSGFSGPAGVAVDSRGNVFVADQNHNAVKEILAVGGYTTVVTVGSGFAFPADVVVDGSGNVFVADDRNNAIKEIVAAGGYTTVVTLGSGFNGPTGVAVDGNGNVFVADTGNRLVKEILATGGYRNVNVLGSGFTFPRSVAVDGAGNVYVADENVNAIKEIFAAGGYTSITTLSSNFYNPTGVALDSNGNVFVADNSHNAVKEIVGGTQMVPTTAVGSVSSSTQVAFTFDSGGSLASTPYLVLTQGNPTGYYQAAASQDPNACARNHTYSAGDQCTVEVTFAPARPGDFLGAVQLVGASGAPIATDNLYGTGKGPMLTFNPPTQQVVGAGFTNPIVVAFDGRGDVFVATPGSPTVSEIVAVNGVISATSSVVTVGGGFNAPFGLAVDGSGNVFVADTRNGVIKEIVAVGGAVSSTSPINTFSSFPFVSPTGVAVDKNGNIFVADAGVNGPVYEIMAVNGAISSASTLQAIGSGFASPRNLAVDINGNVYVADFNNNAVKEIVAVDGLVSSSSTVQTLGSGFTTPNDVAVAADGNIVVADYGNNAVEQILAVNGIVSPSSPVQTLATGLTSPEGVAVDGSGNIVVAETNLNQVVALNVAVAPTLNYATTMIGSTSTDSPQTVTLTNQGNAPLVFEVPETGYNPSLSRSFTLGNSSTCPLLGMNSGAATLASGASCTEVISFSPVSAGVISGSLTFTDNHLNASGPAYAHQSVSLSGTGTVGPASALAATTPPATIVSGGNLGMLPATVTDAAGNTVTTSSAPVTSTITGPNGYSQSVTSNAVNGVAPLNLSSLTLIKAGLYTVTTSSPGLSSSSSNVTVMSGAASTLVVSAPTTITSGGAPGTVTATVQDANGNTVTTSAATVSATITGPNGYSQTVTGTAVNGVVTLNLSGLNFTVVGTYTITTTSAGLPTASSTFMVTAGAASTLTVATPPTPVTSGGNLGTLAATVRDAYGNTVTSSSVPVTTTITGPNGYSQSVTANAVNGVAPLNLSGLPLINAGLYTVTTSSPGLPSSTATVTVNSQPQTIALPSLPNTVFGVGSTTLPAVTSAGLPIAYTVTGPAMLNGSTLIITGAGVVTVSAIQAGNGAYAPASATQTFNVAKAASAVSLVTSSGVVITGNPLTMTAQVSTPAGTPTGTVTFFNGSTAIGTVPLTSTNSASLTLSTPPTGILNLTAVFSGDNNFVKATSAPQATNVQDFGISTASGTPSIPVVPGAAASFNLALTPGVSGFLSPITLTASGLPIGATYSFSPASVTPGSTTSATVLTVQTANTLGMARSLGGGTGVVLALFALPFSVSRRSRRLLRGRLLGAAFGLLLLSGLAGLTGCGTGNGFFGQPAQSYTVTVTATSGSLVHSTTVILNVQ